MPEQSPNLIEAEVVHVTWQHIKGLFPKTCPNCHRVFATYREYLLNSKPIGLPVSYDLEFGEWRPDQSAGNLSLANCKCGTTLSLSSDGMPRQQLWRVLYWIKLEAERRHIKVSEVLAELRLNVRKQELRAGD
jgi:hypothetical protein